MRKGFALIEALAVMALAGVLVYGASSALMNLAPKYRLKKAAWEVQTRLNYARYRAIFEGCAFRVRFEPDGYVVEKHDETLDEWRPAARGSVEGVAIEANNSPTFYPVGTVSNLATILVFNSWGTYRITIAISGRVKAALL
jgi:prepilin-type N-terminal cleavage/methylation domain-containing protein